MRFSRDLPELFSALILLSGVWCSTQVSADVVVPNANEADDAFNEGNRYPLLVDGGLRYQQVYDSSEFASLAPGGQFIDALWFRPDDEFGSAFGPLTLNGITVNLSTTQASPDGLSSTFAANVGGDNTTVRSGRVTIFSDFLPGPGNTRAFDVFIEFTTPFFYDPANGNLLLDITNSDPANNDINNFFDSVNSTSDSVSRAFSNEGDSGAASGFTDSVGLVTKFRTSQIPEPGTAGLIALGLVGLGIRRRR